MDNNIFETLAQERSIRFNSVNGITEYLQTLYGGVSPRIPSSFNMVKVYPEKMLIASIDKTNADNIRLNIIMNFVTGGKQVFKTAKYENVTLDEYTNFSFGEVEPHEFLLKSYRFALPIEEVQWVLSLNPEDFIYSDMYDDNNRKAIMVGTDSEKVYAAYLLRFKNDS